VTVVRVLSPYVALYGGRSVAAGQGHCACTRQEDKIDAGGSSVYRARVTRVALSNDGRHVLFIGRASSDDRSSALFTVPCQDFGGPERAVNPPGLPLIPG
jgi:hypothetical protein